MPNSASTVTSTRVLLTTRDSYAEHWRRMYGMLEHALRILKPHDESSIRISGEGREAENPDNSSHASATERLRLAVGTYQCLVVL